MLKKGGGHDNFDLTARHIINFPCAESTDDGQDDIVAESEIHFLRKPWSTLDHLIIIILTFLFLFCSSLVKKNYISGMKFFINTIQNIAYYWPVSYQYKLLRKTVV